MCPYNVKQKENLGNGCRFFLGVLRVKQERTELEIKLLEWNTKCVKKENRMTAGVLPCKHSRTVSRKENYGMAKIKMVHSDSKRHQEERLLLASENCGRDSRLIYVYLYKVEIVLEDGKVIFGNIYISNLRNDS
jgi:hypothetical protein